MLSLLVLVAAFGWLVRFAYTPPSLAEELSLDRVYELARTGNIRFAKLLDEDAVLLGRRCSARSAEARPNPSAPEVPAVPGAGGEQTFPESPSEVNRQQRSPCRPPLKSFQVSYPRSDVSTQQLIELMTTGGAEVVIDKQTATSITKLLVTFVFPLVMLANLFGIIFLARSSDSSMADIAGFGKIGKKTKKKGDEARPSTGVTFADVGGADEAVAELTEVTDYLKDPKKFEAYGAAAPKGVLLFGPPGCGKTLLARAVAGEAGVPFFSVSGAEFIESLVGVGAARVRDLFRQVKEVAPAIVFIDEIDAVGRKRSGEGSTGGEREQTVNQLLVELDGFEVTAGVVLMGATNRPDILDPALLRPGRFDRHVTLETPDINGRQVILELHAKGKPIAEDADFEFLARRTAGFTGADLANVINEASLLVIREGQEGAKVQAHHLTEAIQRVLHGPQRRGKLMNAEERRRLAFHESGHALVAACLGRGSSIQRVTIVARGQGLGSSTIYDEPDRVLLTASEMKSSLAIALAGIAAEQVVFSESSSTSKDDLGNANALAREMVGALGMSDRLRLLRVLDTDRGYLGTEAAVVEAISGQTLAAFDEEVQMLLEKAQATATQILSDHRQAFELMAKALEAEETLEGTELQAFIGPDVFKAGGIPANGSVPPSGGGSARKAARTRGASGG